MYHDEHDKKALNALAADMGLPLVMLGSDATRRLDALTENGTTPGQQPSRTDAASLSVAEATRKEHEAEAEHNACGVVESAAWDVLVGSGLTDEQHKFLSAYHTRVYMTRDAYIKLVHARAATSFAIRMNGGAK